MADAPNPNAGGTYDAKLKYSEELSNTRLIEHLLEVNRRMQATIVVMRQAAEQQRRNQAAMDRLTESIRRQQEEARKWVAEYKAAKHAIGQALKSIGASMARGVFDIARKGSGVLSALFASVHAAGDSFLQFAITSKNTSNAVQTLSSSYGDLMNAANRSGVSIVQLSKVLTDFQSKGLAQAALGGEKAFQTATKGMLGSLTSVLGRDTAEKMFSQFTSGVDFALLKDEMTKSLGPLVQQFDNIRIKVEADPVANKALLGEMSNLAGAIRKQLASIAATMEDPASRAAMLQMANTFDTVVGKMKGKSTGAIDAVTSLNDAGARLRSIWEDTLTALFQGDQGKGFGTDLANAIGYIEKAIITKLVPAIKEGVKWLLENRKKIEEGVIDAWNKAAAVFDWIVKKVKEFFSVIKSGWDLLPSLGKTAIVSLLAIEALFPSLIGGFRDLGRAAWAFGKSILNLKSAPGILGSIPKMLGGLGAVGGTAAVIGGAAIGDMLGSTIGSFAAEGIASFFTTDKKTQETAGKWGKVLGGVGGGAAAGALIGSFIPVVGTGVGAAIGAAVGGVMEIAKAWKSHTEHIKAVDDYIASVKEKTDAVRVAAQKVQDTSLFKLDREKAALESMKADLEDFNARKKGAEELGKTGEAAELGRKAETLQAQIDIKQSDIDKTMAGVGTYKLPVDLEVKRQSLQAEFDKIKNELSALQGRADLTPQEEENKNQLQERQKQLAGILNEYGNYIIAQGRSRALDIQINEALQNRVTLQQRLAATGSAADKKALAEAEERLKALEAEKGKEQATITGSIAVDPKAAQAAIAQLQKEFSEFELKAPKMNDTGAVDEQVEKFKNRAADLQAQLKDKMDPADLKRLEGLIENLNQRGSKLRETFGSGDFEALTKLETMLKEVEIHLKEIAALQSSVESMASLFGTIGLNFEVAGQSAAALAKDAAMESMKTATEGVVKAQEAWVAAQEAIARADNPKARALATQRAADAWQAMTKAAQGYKAAIAGITAQGEAAFKLAEMKKESEQASLDIIRAFYGTAALSVEQQYRVVEAMEEQKQALESQLAALQDLMKTAQGENLLELQKKELELRTRIKRVTAEQLQQVKELKDGYLQAVNAQVSAGGAFEEIIVTQEKNTAQALDKGIFKANYLVGQVREAAKAGDVGSMRFTTTPGVLEDTFGTALAGDQLADYVNRQMENIADPIQRGLTRTIGQITMGIQREAAVPMPNILPATGLPAGRTPESEAASRLARRAALTSGGLGVGGQQGIGYGMTQAEPMNEAGFALSEANRRVAEIITKLEQRAPEAEIQKAIEEANKAGVSIDRGGAEQMVKAMQLAQGTSPQSEIARKQLQGLQEKFGLVQETSAKSAEAGDDTLTVLQRTYKLHRQAYSHGGILGQIESGMDEKTRTPPVIQKAAGATTPSVIASIVDTVKKYYNQAREAVQTDKAYRQQYEDVAGVAKQKRAVSDEAGIDKRAKEDQLKTAKAEYEAAKDAMNAARDTDKFNEAAKKFANAVSAQAKASKELKEAAKKQEELGTVAKNWEDLAELSKQRKLGTGEIKTAEQAKAARETYDKAQSGVAGVAKAQEANEKVLKEAGVAMGPADLAKAQTDYDAAVKGIESGQGNLMQLDVARERLIAARKAAGLDVSDIDTGQATIGGAPVVVNTPQMDSITKILTQMYDQDRAFYKAFLGPFDALTPAASPAGGSTKGGTVTGGGTTGGGGGSAVAIVKTAFGQLLRLAEMVDSTVAVTGNTSSFPETNSPGNQPASTSA